MRYALAVAEILHFGRASEQLLVSQPSLSRQVRALEQEIGVALFERTSRQVRLTAAGEQFMPLARRALDLLDLAAERAQESARGALGQLRLGFVATAAIDVLPRALALHRAHRPRVSINLSEYTSGEQVRALVAGDLDLGIGRDVPAVDGLQVEVIRAEPVSVAVTQSDPLVARSEVRLEDLVGHPTVRLPPGRAPQIDALWAQVPETAVNDWPNREVVHEANQYMTILALVEAGMGIALVPQPVTQLRQSGVCFLSLAHAEASSTLTLAYRADDRSPLVRDFRELIMSSELALT
ncbi:MAG: LysR family transcriptional regulator [Microlunatus sp.]|nr:LysR family transcriptional regulator [Microlunatus sp.]